ncbi:restriction endonuclease subunit S [Pseudomonas prosekii]|uniref:restriction endonuclease subunit S n=1 Tax=Pseudomonas prosekii TaxID=1148509 RepID=UPI0028DE389B|nr:restriction endonuclease subunit S [Pseudomonas prosekii]MDT8907477.1 restriction endonuclease subunit S [Pseudomonas prosekii]
MTTLLTDNLPLLAGAPNGIKKLRELILELAVRGKLVPQELNDEPASELIKRIEAEKARLVAEGRMKKQKALADIGEEEKPFNVPTNWEWVRVASVGHDWGQKTPDKAFTYIDVGAVDNAAGRISTPQFLMAGDAPSRARKVVRPGTVIYSTIRPYLLNVAVIDEAYEHEPIASTAFAIIHPYLKMPARYFLYYLRSPVFVRYVESVQMGIAYPAINDGLFFSGLVPLPPLAEQHRIVAKVDELMALCDRLEAQQADADSAHVQLVQALVDSLTQASDATDFAASWQRLAQHFHTLFITESSIDALKKALLQLAVMGKLVQQDPNDEPASTYYARHLALPKNSVRSGKQKIKEKTLIDLNTLPNIPDSWTYKTVDQLYQSGHIFDYADGNHGSFYPRKEEFSDDGVVFLTAAQITDSGSILWEDCPKLSHKKAAQLTKGWSRLGDVFYTHNATVGRTALSLGGVQESFLLGTSVTFYRVNNDSISQPYLYRYFSSSSWAAQAELVMRQTTRNQVSITKQALFFIALPPLAEQHRIAAKVDQLMARCDQLKTRLAQARQLNEQLASTLVEQAVT